jgi:tetratricopeptide (TPR) repeat protein
LLAALLPALSAEEAGKSHVERFSSRQTQDQRAESEAGARLQANPQDRAALQERGLARLRLGRLEEALADLKQAASQQPPSADASAGLAYAYLSAGQLPEAMEAARVSLRQDPHHAGAHFYAGRVLLQTGGDLREAIEHLEKAAEHNPEDLDVQFELFAAYRRAGDLTRAARQMALLRMLLPPQHAGILYSEGLLQADLGNLQVAVERFRRALAANPKLDAARQDLGVALVKTNRWQEAAEVLAPLAQSQAQSFAAAYFHALALQNSQRAADAEAEARRALALRSDSADAHALLGIILAGRGAHAEALEVLTRAAQLDPKNFDAQFYLGRARYALRDLPGSRDAFRAALAIRPDDVEARFFLATVLEAAGEKDPAIAEYRELVARRPQDARGYIGLGAVLAKYGQVEPALEQLRRAREIAPQDFEAALAMGRLLVKEGRVEEGIKSLEESVALAPQSPEAHYQLGLAFRRAGRSADAQREFAEVEQLNRQRRSASAGMGQATTPEEKKP